jgi:putative transposase
MSRTISPITNKSYGLKRVCTVWNIARSTLYRRRQENPKTNRRGPKPIVSEESLLKNIREDIVLSPFKGEGHRKIHARLKRQGIRSSRNRVLRVMRENQLLSPHRTLYRPPTPHDGRITTDRPDVMWGSDGTKVLTIEDGWVWIFSVAEHWNTECLGWHVCKLGDRFAALEPVTQAVKHVYGSLGKGIAAGLKLRIDNGSQYTSDYFLQQITHWGIQPSFGIVKQPETNGVAERFHRTLKDQILDGHPFKNLDEVRETVGRFVKIYNEQWLVAKLGYQSPLEARRNLNKLSGAVA